MWIIPPIAEVADAIMPMLGPAREVRFLFVENGDWMIVEDGAIIATNKVCVEIHLGMRARGALTKENARAAAWHLAEHVLGHVRQRTCD